MAKVFNDNGYSVLTLDYTGHGRSGGKVGFDNATNGEIPKQLELALKTFKEKTNLENQDIILFGHSMGGRAIVEYLIGNPTDFGGIVLVGPQINYSNNAQSSLFTGVNDGEIAPWNTLGDEKSPTPRYTF